MVISGTDFTGQMTQPAVSKHWRNTTKPNRTKHQNQFQ